MNGQSVLSVTKAGRRNDLMIQEGLINSCLHLNPDARLTWMPSGLSGGLVTEKMDTTMASSNQGKAPMMSSEFGVIEGGINLLSWLISTALTFGALRIRKRFCLSDKVLVTTGFHA